jgi:hypothetical protein
MTREELGALADRTTLRPCTRTQAFDTGLRFDPILLDLGGRPGWPFGGAVVYQRRSDWRTEPRREYAELWAVSGHGTPGEAFWSRALLAEVASLDMPDRTEMERDALLAALEVPDVSP